MEKTDAILRRIQGVRKIKQHNLHDCAIFLNISKKEYLKFEQGSEFLSLPEIELLGLFFGVSPFFFFQSNHWEKQKLGILDDNVQPQYISLRQKMITARIIEEMHSKSITKEELQKQTGIPLVELDAYFTDEKPIPLDRLLKISKILGLTEKELINPFFPDWEDGSEQTSENQWQREFSSTEIQEQVEEGSYNQLMLALQKLPKRDQAEIAKMLLKKLQSTKNE